MPTTTTLRARALACASSQRVRILVAHPTAGQTGYGPPEFVRAEVAPSQPGRSPARVQLADATWFCTTCGIPALARTDLAGQCKHIAIVAMLTGHASAADKAYTVPVADAG